MKAEIKTENVERLRAGLRRAAKELFKSEMLDTDMWPLEKDEFNGRIDWQEQKIEEWVR